MPPRAVCKIRPSGAVPNILMCAEQRDQDRGDGVVRVPLSATTGW